MEKIFFRGENIISYIKALGATNCRFIPSNLLVPDEKIRKYCYENVCGCYNKHLTCPPNIGTIAEIKERLAGFNNVILIQYSENIDVQNDKSGLIRTKLKLHDIILKTEKYLEGFFKAEDLWGMIGGNCSLCDECAGFIGEECRYPDKARTSMEAIGIDVIAILKSLNLDSAFHKDMIIWTGAVLVRGEIT